ncbi:MAG: hypothetical protein AAFX99_21320, partial [Myxococcota bacterium]
MPKHMPTPLMLVAVLLSFGWMAGCESRPEETIQLVRVSSSLLSSSSPPGHQPRAVAVDGDNRVWMGSRDAGLSLMMPTHGRFLLLTPDIAPFGADISDLQVDPTSGDLIVVLGDRNKRIVRYDPRRRLATLLERPPTPNGGAAALDLRDPARAWAQGVAVMSDGTIWASTQEPPKGIHVALGDPAQHVFIEDTSPNPAPHMLVPDGAGGVWALSEYQAQRYDLFIRQIQVSIDLTPAVVELRGLEWGGNAPAFRHVEGAAAVGSQLWIAADDMLWWRRGARLEPFTFMESARNHQVTRPKRVDIMRSSELLWAQLGRRFVSFHHTQPSQVKDVEMLAAPEVGRLLGGKSGSMWVGHQHGLSGYDTNLTHERPYFHVTTLPSPDGVYGSTDPMLLPQRLLRTDRDLLLAGWGAPPASYDDELGTWKPLPLDAGRNDSSELATTVVTSGGSPMLLTRTGIRRWNDRLQQFGAVVELSGFLNRGERLDVALDQFDGVVALACPADPWAEVESCRKVAYVPPTSTQAVPLSPSDGGCIKPIDNGLKGWLTSDRMAVRFCTLELMTMGPVPEAIQGLKAGLDLAISKMLDSQAAEFEPLTSVNAALETGWVVTRGQLGVWKLNGTVELPTIDRDAELLRKAATIDRDHRRFVMDSAGNLCHMRPTISKSYAEIGCTNTLGRRVLTWLDKEGRLGSLNHARLRVSPDGRLWIDGLRGRIAWLEQKDSRIYVVRLEQETRYPMMSERPLSRIMGFDRDARAWVSSRDVWRVEARLDGFGEPLEPRPMSSRRLWERDRWPLAPLAGTDSSHQFVFAGPNELMVASLGGTTSRQPNSVVFRRMFGDERSPVGSEVVAMDAGRDLGELWVGLSDGGVLHYVRGQTRKRFSRRSGLSKPQVTALTSLDWGAVVATPEGMFWLDPEHVRARRILAPEMAGARVVALTSFSTEEGELVFAITDRGAIWRMMLAIQAPAPLPEVADAEDVAPKPQLKSYTPISPETLKQLETELEARPTTALVLSPK